MSKVHCYFCGGADCKYENWKIWVQNPNAFDGVYSNWITDNILAMARPSTKYMEEYKIVKAFAKAGITSIINLQEPGEHEQCGNGIHASSGFSYLPETWMSAGMQFYNFGWPDMDIPEFSQMLNLVQVMSFCLSEGGKVAVHCHAGLGRTGLTIACYLVYAKYMRPTQAIELIRSKRSGSVQTKRQQLFVQAFEEYLQPMRIVFAGILTEYTPLFVCNRRLCWSLVMDRQAAYLHGVERRTLKHIPKFLFVATTELASRTGDYDAISSAVCAYQGLKPPICSDMLSAMFSITRNNWQVNHLDSELLVQMLLYWLTSFEEPILSSKVLLACETQSGSLTVQNMPRALSQALSFIMHHFKTITNQACPLTVESVKEKLAIVLSDHRLFNKLEHPYAFEIHSQHAADVKDASQSAMLLLKLETLKPASETLEDSSGVGVPGLVTPQAGGSQAEQQKEKFLERPSSPTKRLSAKQALTSWASSLSLTGKSRSSRQAAENTLAESSLAAGISSAEGNSPLQSLNQDFGQSAFEFSTSGSYCNQSSYNESNNLSGSAASKKTHSRSPSNNGNSKRLDSFHGGIIPAPTTPPLKLKSLVELINFYWNHARLMENGFSTNEFTIAPTDLTANVKNDGSSEAVLSVVVNDILDPETRSCKTAGTPTAELFNAATTGASTPESSEELKALTMNQDFDTQSGKVSKREFDTVSAPQLDEESQTATTRLSDSESLIQCSKVLFPQAKEAYPLTDSSLPEACVPSSCGPLLTSCLADLHVKELPKSQSTKTDSLSLALQERGGDARKTSRKSSCKTVRSSVAADTPPALEAEIPSLNGNTLQLHSEEGDFFKAAQSGLAVNGTPPSDLINEAIKVPLPISRRESNASYSF